MSKLLNKYKNIFFLFNGFLFSLFTFLITANLKIINPTNANWLEAGDGIAEISWEFFRRQPVFQFPLGLNPNYGLEISSTMAFDGQIPIMSLFFHPFSHLLSDRFQYYGIFLLITFVLNYYFASKIFQLLKMNNIQIILNSVILSLSPIILNRLIENTHYALTSAWIIFWAIYLCVENKNNLYQWIVLFNLIVLIHFYYMLFVYTLFFINLIVQLMRKKIKLITALIQNIIIFASVVSNMYIIGYFYGGVSSEDIGYGLFRSTLLSLLDPSGWSIIIPDFPELDGTYEGFSYLGSATLLLLIIYLLTFKRKENKLNQVKINSLPIWISSVILFMYSLSNKVAIGKIELFEFPIPSFFETFANTFRSTGRYTWLLVFFIFIWITIQLFTRLNPKSYTLILVFVLIFSFLDSSRQLVSEKNEKFTSVYKTNLVNPAWLELNNCYKNIRIYPPVAGVDNVYNFLNLANQLEMGINTARLGRFSQIALNNAFADMQNQMQKGLYLNDTFYLFSASQFVGSDVINYHKNLALKTIDADTGWGELDGFTFIAPNLKNCENVDNLLRNSVSIGPKESYIYKGGEIKFGLNKNSDNYALTSFSQLFDWGVSTSGYSSLITLNVDPSIKLSELIIGGRSLSSEYDKNQFIIEINDNFQKTCSFKESIDYCFLNLDGLILNNRILNIKFIPQNKIINQDIPQLGLVSLEIK